MCYERTVIFPIIFLGWHGTQVVAIVLSTVNFSHSHYNIIWRVCDAISGYFVASAQNCLTSTLNYIVIRLFSFVYDYEGLCIYYL